MFGARDHNSDEWGKNVALLILMELAISYMVIFSEYFFRKSHE